MNHKPPPPLHLCKQVAGLGCIFLFLAVAFGAFGAHALRDILGEYEKSVYQTAVFYHFTHAVGLCLLSLFAKAQMISGRLLLRLSWVLSLGIFLFSGSLYVLAMTGARWLGAVTPFGGVLFLSAWLISGINLLRKRESSS